MKKDFVVSVEVNWDASHIEKVSVRTNNERNAEKLALNKLSKRFSPGMMTVRSVKEAL